MGIVKGTGFDDLAFGDGFVRRTRFDR